MIIAIIILILCILGAIFCFISLLKNENTLKQEMLILKAIRDYNIDCIRRGDLSEAISYDDMEAPNKTFWRFWDWGHKHILPKEKYELIKNYINN